MKLEKMSRVPKSFIEQVRVSPSYRQLDYHLRRIEQSSIEFRGILYIKYIAEQRVRLVQSICLLLT